MKNLVASLMGGVGLLALASSPSHAILQISAQVNGGAIFTCQDQQASCDTNLAPGTLTLGQTTIGGVVFNGSSQTQTIGPPTNGLVTGSQTITNNTGSTATILFAVSGTDFAAPTATYNAAGSITYLNAPTSTVDLQWYADTANQQGASTPADLPGTLLEDHNFTSTTIADSFATGPLTGPLVTTDPFSWTMFAGGTLVSGATATISNRGQVITNDVVAVPEPGTLGLLGSGLAAMGWFVNRRRKRNDRFDHSNVAAA